MVRLPDDTPDDNSDNPVYSATKTVDMVTLVAPVLKRETVKTPGQKEVYIVVSVVDPIPGAAYEWDVNGSRTTTSSHSLRLPSPYVNLLAFTPPVGKSVRCRTRIGGNVSAWSNAVVVMTGRL